TTSILNGCMDSATYTDYIDCSDITGISGLSSGTVFHAFPNPGNGIFSIRVPETGEGFFTLSDISGKVIRILPSHRGNPFTLDIRNLQPGIFFLRDESSGMTLRLISNP
ncbi:MAG: T9SS type A sorting domain-containing protein, partial [Bacteroidia bacterium]|nr:T9SS type A sorting domain-containing protein [Bacteroidia bacterium]